MSPKYTDILAGRVTSVTMPVPGREAEMVKRPDGGYLFTVDDWMQLKRFLIIGSAGGSYYMNAEELTKQNAAVVLRCAFADVGRTAEIIMDVARRDLAFRMDTLLFALAIMAENGFRDGTAAGEIMYHAARQSAFGAAHVVCRTASHFLQFQAYIKALGGKWNASRRKYVQSWYTNKHERPDALAYQTLKYQNRAGWSHGDLIRLAHITDKRVERNALYRYLVKGEAIEGAPELVAIYETMKAAQNVEAVVKLIADHGLTHEFVPDQWKGHAAVWAALVPNLPYTALLRNLGRLSANGVIGQNSTFKVGQIGAMLLNQEKMQRQHVHPISILLALKVYEQGHGEKGKLKWTPNRDVLGMLDDAFYLAFKNVIPTGKRILLALDVSTSMFQSQAGDTPLNVAEVAAAMSMVLRRTEEAVHTMAFAHDFRPVTWGPEVNLKQVLDSIRAMGFGATDCSMPMRFAHRERLVYDAFVTLSDGDSNVGPHPFQMLKLYRDEVNPEAKYIFAGMVADSHTTGDPRDERSFHAIGFSADFPQIVSGFVNGEF